MKLSWKSKLGILLTFIWVGFIWIISTDQVIEKQNQFIQDRQYYEEINELESSKTLIPPEESGFWVIVPPIIIWSAFCLINKSTCKNSNKEDHTIG